MIARRNMSCMEIAGKHVNNIRAIARQPSITTRGTVGGDVSCRVRPRAIQRGPQAGSRELRVQFGHEEPERRKLKNPYCLHPLTGNGY
jgi:hypothetical protein